MKKITYVLFLFMLQGCVLQNNQQVTNPDVIPPGPSFVPFDEPLNIEYVEVEIPPLPEVEELEEVLVRPDPENIAPPPEDYYNPHADLPGGVPLPEDGSSEFILGNETMAPYGCYDLRRRGGEC